MRKLAQHCFMEFTPEIPILGALTNYYYYNLYLYPDSSSATTPPRPSSRCVLVRARATATSAPSCGRRGSGWSSRATPPPCRYTRGTCDGVTWHVAVITCHMSDADFGAEHGAAGHQPDGGHHYRGEAALVTPLPFDLCSCF